MLHKNKHSFVNANNQTMNQKHILQCQLHYVFLQRLKTNNWNVQIL